MGSSVQWKHLGAGVVILLAVVALRTLPSEGGQPLRHDHTKEWGYVKVAHRPASELERRLGEIASVVARRPVQVRCEDFSAGKALEPGGVVQFNGEQSADFTRIRPDVCTALLQFMRRPAGTAACARAGSCDSRVLRSADALTVLAHESSHLEGIRNEAVAQCYAMQAVPRIARALGASTEDGHALASLEYAFAYPRMPPAYRSPDCRSGGALDRSPRADWP